MAFSGGFSGGPVAISGGFVEEKSLRYKNPMILFNL
jgi:hypothetical protein